MARIVYRWGTGSAVSPDRTSLLRQIFIRNQESQNRSQTHPNVVRPHKAVFTHTFRIETTQWAGNHPIRQRVFGGVSRCYSACGHCKYTVWNIHCNSKSVHLPLHTNELRKAFCQVEDRTLCRPLLLQNPTGASMFSWIFFVLCVQPC